MVEHRNLLNVVWWHVDFFGLTSEDRHAQVIAPAFDPVALEVWPMLLIGGSLHICDDETRLSPAEFVNFVNEREITICTLATPVAELMMQAEWPEHTTLKHLYAGDHLTLFCMSYL
jgi:non-ribosomal peptide synthetase component F